MERTAVRSREIAIVGYDPRTQILEIAFRRGGVYRYHGVSSEVHETLMNSPSMGSYFADQVKDKYPYRRLR